MMEAIEKDNVVFFATATVTCDQAGKYAVPASSRQVDE
jgi:hypothetical protein